MKLGNGEHVKDEKDNPPPLKLTEPPVEILRLEAVTFPQIFKFEYNCIFPDFKLPKTLTSVFQSTINIKNGKKN